MLEIYDNKKFLFSSIDIQAFENLEKELHTSYRLLCLTIVQETMLMNAFSTDQIHG